jgi:hypothetical protein
MTELEETGADPAAAEYRQRIRDRYRERAAAEQQLAERVSALGSRVSALGGGAG